MECTLIPALAALINGAGNLPALLIPRGRVRPSTHSLPRWRGPRLVPEGLTRRWAKASPAQHLWGGVVQDVGTIAWRVLCCPGNTHTLCLEPKGAERRTGRVGPQGHPVQGPAARARLAGAGASPVARLRAGPGRPPKAFSLGPKLPAPANLHFSFHRPANTSCKFASLSSVSTGARGPSWGSPSLSRQSRPVPLAREHLPCSASLSRMGCSRVRLLP